MRMTTRWVGEPLVPDFSKDVSVLVPLARKARRRMVEFDWELSEDEARHLREAVMSWGAGVRGRYKKFDAQVLDALAEALQEDGSPYHLSIPTRGADVDSHVEGSRAGDTIRLRGRVGFDVALGYSVGQGDDYRMLLGDSLAERLRASIAELGWDVDRLRSPAYKAALNALWSLPLTWATGSTTLAEPTREHHLHFTGPMVWDGPTGAPRISDSPLRDQNGIYLITVPIRGVDHVHYVGQTIRGFAERLGEHMSSFVSGKYTILDPELLARGEQRELWRGVSSGAEYLERLPKFLTDLETLAPRVRELVRLFRCYAAPMKGDKQLLDKIEGGLGRYFNRCAAPEDRVVFGKGARHPASIPGAERVRLHVKSDTTIAGLPGELVV